MNRKKATLLTIIIGAIIGGGIGYTKNIQKPTAKIDNIKLLVNEKIASRQKQGVENEFASIGYNTTTNNPNNGYCFWYGINYSNPNWMAGINNNVKLSQLSIPGTHDSMTYKQWGNYDVQTQTMTLSKQLNSGIRFIDIRLGDFNHKMYLYHGNIELEGTFNNVLNTVTEFLKQHPTETVFIRIAQATRTDASNQVFNADTWNYLKQSKYWKYFFKQNGWGFANPTLGSMRGKFVILNYQQGNNPPGINIKYDFNRQDNYNFSTDWGLYQKWIDVKNQLIAANNNNNNNNSTPYINYLNASGGGLPYFFASGHVTPSTWAGFLWTGVLSNQTEYDQDFPRFGIGIYFEGIDFLATKYIENHDLNYVGIIPADFPGAGIINSVINVNKNNFVNGIQKESGKIYYFKDGKMVKNHWENVDLNGKNIDETPNGKTVNAYYFGSNGVAEKGLQTIDGKIQYLNLSTGEMEFDKFITVKGNRYYLRPINGIAAIGLKTIDGKKYYFDGNGIMQTGWINIDQSNKMRTYNAVSTDKKSSNGTVAYYFNPVTGAAESGLKYIEGAWQYLNPVNNIMELNKFVNIDKKIYYLQPITGQAAIGDIKIQGQNYIFNSKGKLNIGKTKLLNSNLWLYGTPNSGWDTIGSIKFGNDLKIKIIKGTPLMGLVANENINPHGSSHSYLTIKLENIAGSTIKSLTLKSNILGQDAVDELYDTFNNVSYSNLDKIVVTSNNLNIQDYAIGTSTKNTNVINGSNSVWTDMSCYSNDNNSVTFIIDSNRGVIPVK